MFCTQNSGACNWILFQAAIIKIRSVVLMCLVCSLHWRLKPFGQWLALSVCNKLNDNEGTSARSYEECKWIISACKPKKGSIHKWLNLKFRYPGIVKVSYFFHRGSGYNFQAIKVEKYCLLLATRDQLENPPECLNSKQIRALIGLNPFLRPRQLSRIEIESELSNCFSINLLVVQKFKKILFTDTS